MSIEEAIKLIDDRMCFGRGKWSEHHQPVIDEYWQAGEMAIKALEAEPHWTPVTERLPEKGNTSYLTTLDYGEYGMAVGQRFFFGDNIGWNDEAVIAWMPLPEPFKGVTS